MSRLNLAWSAAREVVTKYGPRMMRTAEPTEEFWGAWRANKESLKAAGLSVGKTDAGAWRVTEWLKLASEVTQSREQTVAASRATDTAIELPCPEGRAYLPYQKAGIQFAASRPATLIGDEMGLGKTIQAIGAINVMPEARHVLIICPASLKLNWERECRRWLIKQWPISIANGHWPEQDYGIVIVNYDVLHKYQRETRARVWDVVIVDEAHYLKNGKARRTRQVVGCKPTAKQSAEGIEPLAPIQAKRKLLLTGTPIANKPIELFTLINFLDPIAWPNYFAFAKRYCAAHRNKYGWDFTGASNLAELQQRLRSTIMVRRLKSEVLTELPPKQRQVIELPAIGAAATAVAEEHAAYEARAERLLALQAAVELAKASANPQEHADAVRALQDGVQVAFAEMAAVRQRVALAKLPMVLDHLADIVEERKVVVMAHHKSVIAKLAEHFGDDAAVLTGDTSVKDRQAAVDRFQTDPACKVFIGSLLAAGVGITLTAASHVVFVELDWVPGNLSQGEDRCHRIGQHDSVLVQHLVLEGSLDAVMAKRIIEKQEIIDRALDRDGKPVYAPEPVVKEQAATVATTPDKLAKAAEGMTATQIDAAHMAVRMLAGLCDGARELDGAGFSKIDTRIGHTLASAGRLTPRQGALAAILARKYRRQLPEDLISALAQ